MKGAGERSARPAAARTGSSACVIKTLENPMLNGIALGLGVQEDGQLAVQSAMFPCCAAQGMAWDAGARGYHSCPIKQRVRRVQSLMQEHKRLWPGAQRSPHQVPPAWGGQVLQEIALVLRHDRPPATICYTQQRQQPSLLWSKALATTWRFGVESRFLHLLNTDVKGLADFTRNADGPLALFVEQVDKLWDPLNIERLEFIVQCAYNAQAFLWIDFVADTSSGPEKSDDMSLKANVARRLAKIKAQHPLDYIGKDCLSRLQHLCGGTLRGDTKHA